MKIIILLIILSSTALAENSVKEWRAREAPGDHVAIEGTVDEKYNGKRINAACYDDSNKKYIGNGFNYIRGGTFLLFISKAKLPYVISCKFSIEN